MNIWSMYLYLTQWKHFLIFVFIAYFARYFGNIKGSENNEFLAYVSKFKEVNLTIFDDFDLGTFECTANNILGQANKTFEVKKGFIPPKFNIAKVCTPVDISLRLNW